MDVFADGLPFFRVETFVEETVVESEEDLAQRLHCQEAILELAGGIQVFALRELHAAADEFVGIERQ